MSPLLEHFGGSPMRIREYECWEFKIKEIVSEKYKQTNTKHIQPKSYHQGGRYEMSVLKGWVDSALGAFICSDKQK